MNDEPTERVEDTQDLTRVKRAYHIACVNLTEMNDKCAALSEALVSALNLLDHLMTDMRIANVTPSAPVIIHKAKLDAARRKLFPDT